MCIFLWLKNGDYTETVLIINIRFAELEHPASKTLFARQLSSAGTVLGKVAAVDKDKDDKVTYEITGKFLVKNNAEREP